MERFREKILSGLGWSIVAQIARQVISFIISVILARLLMPKDFGLIGMIVIFTGFAALFNELGFSGALIQKERTEDRHYSSIFWLNIGCGFVLMLAMIAAAPWIAKFFDEPRLLPVARLVSLNFLLGAFNIVQKTLLRRSLNFRILAGIEIASTVISGTTAVFLAFMGYGPFALAWQILIFTFAGSIFFWTMSGWYPRIQFDWAAVCELFRFSINLLGSRVIAYWARRADNLIVGKFLGSEALGIYSRAYNLMLLPLSQVTYVVGRVMFPALSRIQSDKVRVKEVYLRSIRMISLLTFPVMLALPFVADSFVLALYGPKWAGIIPILQILCAVGLVQSILATSGWIYTSQGRTDWQLWWTAGTGMLTIIAFVLGVKWGMIGIAVAYTIRVYGTLYFAIAIPGMLINMSFFEVVRALAGTFCCAAAMALLVWVVDELLPTNWGPLVYLAVEVPLGIAVYGGLVHLFRLRSYLELRGVVVEKWRLWNNGHKPAASNRT